MSEWNPTRPATTVLRIEIEQHDVEAVTQRLHEIGRQLREEWGGNVGRIAVSVQEVGQTTP